MGYLPDIPASNNPLGHHETGVVTNYLFSPLLLKSSRGGRAFAKATARQAKGFTGPESVRAIVL